MLFLQCLTSVTDWTAWKHADDTQKGSAAWVSVHMDIMIASVHSVSNLHNTPLTLRLNIHKSSAWVTRVMVRMCADHRSWFEGSWRAYLLHFPHPGFQRALMFLQASCQIQLSTAHGHAVKAGRERGDTGHCNEHLWDVALVHVRFWNRKQ